MKQTSQMQVCSKAPTESFLSVWRISQHPTPCIDLVRGSPCLPQRSHQKCWCRRCSKSHLGSWRSRQDYVPGLGRMADLLIVASTLRKLDLAGNRCQDHRLYILDPAP